MKTSVQADLALKPETHLPCSPEETAQGCWYRIDPAITQADIEANYWRSAHIMAHELGHNLGLLHNASDSSDLMYPSIESPRYYTASYSLTDAEVATILRSPFVQMDANGQRFISITPFSVLAPLPPAAVPLPAAWWMFASGMGLLAWRARGKSCVAA
ncbi:MAG: matrixin family metalloprotease [Methylomonas sp.]|nr:matrixin family metalloprotease [Methylomonas sp.]